MEQSCVPHTTDQKVASRGRLPPVCICTCSWALWLQDQAEFWAPAERSFVTHTPSLRLDPGWDQCVT